jgi:hypothetical protein
MQELQPRVRRAVEALQRADFWHWNLAGRQGRASVRPFEAIEYERPNVGIWPFKAPC